MSFTNTAGRINLPQLGSGEVWESAIVLSTGNFDSDIRTGKFGVIANSGNNVGQLKTGGAGTIAGVVVRDIANSLEVLLDDQVDGVTHTVRYVRSGLVSVTVKTGDTPAMFGTVYSTAVGEATTTSSGNASTHAEFIRKVNTDVWLVRLI